MYQSRFLYFPARVNCPFTCLMTCAAKVVTTNSVSGGSRKSIWGGGGRYNRLPLERERERNVLFNDGLNTFYLRLYGVRHVVKDHSDSEKGNPLPPHRLLLSINSKGSFICTIPQTG